MRGARMLLTEKTENGDPGAAVLTWRSYNEKTSEHVQEGGDVQVLQ
jgi:hypothetical protein